MTAAVDVAVAVATPAGLITPIVSRASEKGLMQISADMGDLAARAKAGKLAPEEYQGGTFTVSNLGMFGVREFSAIINMPQAAILAVGGGAPTVLPPKAAGDPPRVATIMTARLSADRRVLDEPLAARFLQVFQHYMSNPTLLLL